MKAIKLICALAAIICLVNCASQGGLEVFTTVSNSDANSCLLNVTYAVEAKRIIFTVFQYIPDPQHQSCTFQNMYSAPLFYNAPFSMVSLNLTQTSGNVNRYRGVWQYADFRAALGSSCAQVGVFGSQETYACRFQYSSIYFYMSIKLTPSNDSFDTTWTDILFPELGTAKPSTKYGHNIWIANTTFPHIIARTENGCNTWVMQVPMSSDVLVLGTQWLGDPLNLKTYLNGTYLLAVLFKKNGAAATNYRFKQMTTDTTPSQPFNSPPSVGQCHDIGVQYSDLLSGAAYCSGGCAVSFMLTKGQTAYVLTTNGVTTTSGLRA